MRTDGKDRVTQLLRDAATRLGYRWRDILTVAGHDAVSMNALYPTAMIFVPSRAGGISHDEREHSTPEDLAAGTNVLLHAVLTKAGLAATSAAPGARDRLQHLERRSEEGRA